MTDIIIILLVAVVPALMLYLGYRSFKRKPTVAPSKSVTEPDDKILLHGHDLAKWNYLGYTRCTYVDADGNITGEYPIFLFASKKDMKRRSYHINSEYAEKNHGYVIKEVKPWAAGEGDIYYLINGNGNKPSDFLKEYMLEHYSCEWDTTKNWWGSSDSAKYTAANNKQKREQKKKETVTEDNVVTVEFGKQA